MGPGTRRPTLDDFERLAWLGFAAAASLAAVTILWLGSGVGYSLDEIDTLIRTPGLDLDGTLEPHNGHFIFTTRVAYWAILEAVRHRLPALPAADGRDGDPHRRSLPRLCRSADRQARRARPRPAAAVLRLAPLTPDERQRLHGAVRDRLRTRGAAAARAQRPGRGHRRLRPALPRRRHLHDRASVRGRRGGRDPAPRRPLAPDLDRRRPGRDLLRLVAAGRGPDRRSARPGDGLQPPAAAGVGFSDPQRGPRLGHRLRLLRRPGHGGAGAGGGGAGGARLEARPRSPAGLRSGSRSRSCSRSGPWGRSPPASSGFPTTPATSSRP